MDKNNSQLSEENLVEQSESMPEGNSDAKEKIKDVLEELPVLPDHITDMEILQLPEELTEEEKELATKQLKPKKEPLSERLKKKNGIWAILGSFLVVLSKLKILIPILKLGKFGTTFISMFIMIYVYAKLYGLVFGTGFVLLLLAHEMGHYLAAKELGINTSSPLFIPFVGAMISLKELPKEVATEAKMAIAGPIMGSISALGCLLLYMIFRQNVLLALAYTGFFLNLFNLIPMHPLDGGRTVSAISPLMWLIGIPVGVIAAIKYYNPILIVLLILGTMEIYKQWKNPEKEYYKVRPMQRVAFAICYFGLIALLGIGMYFIHSFHAGMLLQ